MVFGGAAKDPMSKAVRDALAKAAQRAGIAHARRMATIHTASTSRPMPESSIDTSAPRAPFTVEMLDFEDVLNFFPLLRKRLAELSPTLEDASPAAWARPRAALVSRGARRDSVFSMQQGDRFFAGDLGKVSLVTGTNAPALRFTPAGLGNSLASATIKFRPISRKRRRMRAAGEPFARSPSQGTIRGSGQPVAAVG